MQCDGEPLPFSSSLLSPNLSLLLGWLQSPASPRMHPAQICKTEVVTGEALAPGIAELAEADPERAQMVLSGWQS